MRKIIITKQFKKNLKKATKNPRQNVPRLNEAVKLLVNDGELPEEYLPHKLIGNWTPKLECHIEPDFLLIYEVTESSITLHRCGSHSELFN